MRLSARVIGVAAGLILAPFGTVQAAGFDCAKASSQVEKLICADPELSRLDDELAKDFEAIRRETSGIDGETGKPSFPFGRDQERWRTTVRDKCGNSACLAEAYRTRLAEVRRDWKAILTAQ